MPGRLVKKTETRDKAMMQLSKFLAHFKSSLPQQEPHTRHTGHRKQLLQRSGTNNKCETEVLHSRHGSGPMNSRPRARSEQVTDDTGSLSARSDASLSARSDASLDSSTCEHSFGAIRPDLYPRKDIVVQQSSFTAGQGRLHTRLRYDFRTCDLVVHLIEAQELSASDAVSSPCSDPYIQVSLVPCVDQRVRLSSVRRRTLNPYFNEFFKFPLDFDEVKDKSLQFHIYESDRFSRHSPVGEVEISMANVDVSNGVEIWCDIQRQQKVASECGEILISMSYLPTAERLTVVVMKGRELKPTADPFVRVSLMVDGRKVKRKKTSVKKGSSSPVWNEALTFNVPAEILSKVTLEVSVNDHDLIGQGEILGRCLIGGADGQHSFWRDMLTNPRKAMSTWHVLHF